MSGRTPEAALVALAAVCLFAACGERRTAPQADASAPDRRPAPCHPLPELTGAERVADRSEPASFVITALRFGGESSGLDLDCVDTPRECRDDFCRELSADGPGGVDNRLGPLALRISKLAGSDLQAEMTRAVDRGDHPLILRVVGAPSLEQGPASAVEIEFGLDADDDHSDLRSGRAKVRRDPDGPGRRASRFSPVVIRDGVVSAGPTSDWMPLFWTRGQIAAVPVVEAYLRFRIAEAPSGSPPLGGRVEEGVLAGAIRPADLSKAVLEMDARTAQVLTRLGPVVRALVRQQADLDTIPPGPTARSCRRDRDCPAGQRCERGACREPEAHADAISFAVEFTALSAAE